jgi:hypothetical protein
MMPLSQYELAAILTFKDKTGQATKQAAKGMSTLEKAAIAAGVAFGALKAAQVAVDFAKAGAAIQRQSKALNSLATAAGTSGKAIISSIQGASGFTIDKMTAMQAATQALLMDVAKAPSDFERMTKVAVSLGRAMGVDAAQSIEKFTFAAARQSKLRADDLGLLIEVEEANRRYAEANNLVADSLTDVQKKQAFFNEMMRQGEIKVSELGDTTGDLATDFEILGAAVKDAKDEFALYWAEQATGSVNAEGAAKVIRDLPGRLRHLSAEVKSGASHYQAYNAQLKEHRMFTDRAITGYNGYVVALDKADKEVKPLFSDVTILNETLRNQKLAADLAAQGMREYKDETLDADTILKEFTLSATMAYTEYFKNIDQAAENFADRQADIEASHQEKIAEIMKQGQSRTVRIDVKGERLKLEILKSRLNQALKTRQEFDENTTRLEKLRNRETVQGLRESIAEQQSLLERGGSGWMAIKGKNIDALLAQENEQYAEELALLQEAKAEQERAQQESLGRMIIQQFTAWATMKGIAADKSIEMQIALAEQFGLITSEGAAMARAMIREMEAWANGVGGSADDVAARLAGATQRMKDLQAALEAIPKEWHINVRVHEEMRATQELYGVPETGKHVGGGTQAYQHGGHGGGWAMVGEHGPEPVRLPAGARVNSNT